MKPPSSHLFSAILCGNWQWSGIWFLSEFIHYLLPKWPIPICQRPSSLSNSNGTDIAHSFLSIPCWELSVSGWPPWLHLLPTVLLLEKSENKTMDYASHGVAIGTQLGCEWLLGSTSSWLGFSVISLVKLRLKILSTLEGFCKDPGNGLPMWRLTHIQ